MDEFGPDITSELVLFGIGFGRAAGFNCVHWPCTEHEQHVVFRMIGAIIVIEDWPYFSVSDFIRET